MKLIICHAFFGHEAAAFLWRTCRDKAPNCAETSYFCGEEKRQYTYEICPVTCGKCGQQPTPTLPPAPDHSAGALPGGTRVGSRNVDNRGYHSERTTGTQSNYKPFASQYNDSYESRIWQNRDQIRRMRDWNKQAWFDWTKIYGFGTGRPLPLTTLAPYVPGKQGHDPMGSDFNPWMNMLGRDGDLSNTEPAKNAHFAPSIFDQKSDDGCEDLYPELCQAHISQENCQLEEFWAKCGKTCSMCHATKDLEYKCVDTHSMCSMSYIHQMCMDEKWVREACPVSCRAQTEMCAPMQSYRMQRPVEPVGAFSPVYETAIQPQFSIEQTRTQPFSPNSEVGVLIVDPKPVAPTTVTINPVTVNTVNTPKAEVQTGEVVATEIKSDFTTNVDMSDLCKTTWQSICHLDFVQDACPESCPKNTV
ncbi:unnamed protein product [Oikopleura dioica]|uniref:ShKT domain-containing protein n=1 Tax=Oikopleura dioica TaxID=34765 RepID=E4Y618_OIKDI|nr:unnamed protein product [Oikopleura dioica]